MQKWFPFLQSFTEFREITCSIPQIMINFWKFTLFKNVWNHMNWKQQFSFLIFLSQILNKIYIWEQNNLSESKKLKILKNIFYRYIDLFKVSDSRSIYIIIVVAASRRREPNFLLFRQHYRQDYKTIFNWLPL